MSTRTSHFEFQFAGKKHRGFVDHHDHIYIKVGYGQGFERIGNISRRTDGKYDAYPRMVGGIGSFPLAVNCTSYRSRTDAARCLADVWMTTNQSGQ
jgi:hypothetical protein